METKSLIQEQAGIGVRDESINHKSGFINPRPQKVKNLIFLACILVSTITCGAIYGIYFDDLSEIAMMQIACLWLFLLVTGITGLAFKKHKRQLTIALVYGALALILLIFFYSQIWPML